VFSARVRGGAIVPEDGAFETTPEEELDLLDAVAGVERGETVRAADLLERLRR